MSEVQRMTRLETQILSITTACRRLSLPKEINSESDGPGLGPQPASTNSNFLSSFQAAHRIINNPLSNWTERNGKYHSV